MLCWFRRALAGFLSLMLALGALLASPPRVDAAVGETEYLAAARLLNKYGLVQGDDRGYRFYDQLTRAEMAKLLVYALGQEAEAARLAGRGTFPDTRGHWAEGVVAVARNLGVMRGYPEGDFRPQAVLTYAEVITALSRLAGLDASREPWPRTYLRPAIEAGIIPADMELGHRLGDNAARGDVFVLLWRTLTEVKNVAGQNLLRRYLDQTAPKLTLDPQPETTSDPRLTVSGSVADAARVLVNGTAADLQFGAFQHTVSLRMGPNTIRVQAIDEAGNVKETTVSVTRVEGVPGLLTLSGPAQVAAGQAATFTVSILDEHGTTVSAQGQLQATVDPADLGSFDPLTGRFVAGQNPGTGVITVRAGTATTTRIVSVVAGELDQLVITPAEAAVDAGGTAIFTAKGLDKLGNEVPVGSVSWSTSGGTVSSIGVFQAPATAGTFTVTATAGGRTATARVQPPNYQVTRVELSAPTTRLKANGLSEVQLKATVKDAQGAVVPSYTGTLTITSSNPAVGAPMVQSVPVVDGVANIVVRSGGWPGTARITAATNLGRTATVDVGADPQVLQSVMLLGQTQPSVATEPTGYVEVIALDQDGNKMRSPLAQTVIVNVALSRTDAYFIANNTQSLDVALMGLDPTTGDVRTRTYVRYTAGTGTIIVTGSPVIATQSWLQVLPGALRGDQVGMPAGLRFEPLVDGLAGQAQSIYVNVVDADGYRVTQARPLTGIVVKLRDQNGVEWAAANTATAGLGRVQFDVAQSQAGTYTYTATLQPGNATAAVSHRVGAGAPASITLTADRIVLPADGRTTTTLRAEVRDPAGNIVRDSSYPVTFRRVVNNGAVLSFSEQTVLTTNGVAQVTVTAGSIAAFDEFQATVPNPAAPLTPWSATARITTRGVPERLAISYGDNNRNGSADPGDNTGRVGTPMVVYVDVLDRFGNVAAYEENRSVSLYLRPQAGTQDTLLGTVQTKEGRATFQVDRSQAGTFALKAQSGTLMHGLTAGYGGSVADTVWEAGHGLGLRLVADITTLQTNSDPANPTNYALLTVELVDAANNPISNQTGRPIAVTLSIPEETNPFTYGFFTINDVSTATKTRMRTMIIPAGGYAPPIRFYSGAAGSRTVTATTLDGLSSSMTVTGTTLGSPKGLRIAPIAPVALNLADQTITVDVIDASNRRVSSYNGPVTLTAVDADVSIVAVYDPVTRTWVSWGPGSTHTINADRGQVQVRVRALVAGTKLYEASFNPGTGTVTESAYGRFDP